MFLTWPVVVMMVFYLYLLLRPQPVKSMLFFSLGMGAVALTILLTVVIPADDEVAAVLQAITLTAAFVLTVPAVGPEALEVWRRAQQGQPAPERTEAPQQPDDSDRPQL